MICVPVLRTPQMKKCVPLISKSAYSWRGTQNFINVRILRTWVFSVVDQTQPTSDIRKTLQVLSCKVCGGDSWTRTNGLTSLRSFSQVRNQVEPTSATSMVVTPHCGDHFLSVEKATDEISATGGRRWLSPNRCVHISDDLWFGIKMRPIQKSGPPQG